MAIKKCAETLFIEYLTTNLSNTRDWLNDIAPFSISIVLPKQPIGENKISIEYLCRQMFLRIVEALT